MKLNIEELVRQTFTKQYAEELIMFQSGAIENLAELIVERCAQECDRLKVELFDSSKSPPGMDQMRKSCGMGAAMCATDIRNLMED